MSISASYPNLRPTLLLDFANSGRLDPRVTFTRASTATYFDETGVLQSAAINAPRFDYDPATLAARGFLIEEARTNSIRNNTMQGAAAGTPGTLPTNWAAPTPSNGLNREVVGVGTEDGINYIDIKYSGTTSSAALTPIYPEGSQQVVATTGQTWSSSFYVSVVGGSTANITGIVVGIDENNNLGNFLVGTSTSFTPSSGALSSKRYAHTRTTTNASTAYVRSYVFFQYASGVAIDITLRIGLPQLEQGAFVTSAIPTTTTALTRSADAAFVNTLSPWFNSAGYTLYHEGMVLTNNDGIVYSGLGDTFDNTAYTSRAAPNQTGGVRSGAAVVAQMNINTTPSSGVPFKMAMKVKADDFAFCVDGGAVATDLSGAVPASTVRLGIGSSPWTVSGGNGRQQWVRRVTFYPRALSSAELQAITT